MNNKKKKIVIYLAVGLVLVALLLVSYSFICTNSLFDTSLTKYCKSNLFFFDFSGNDSRDSDIVDTENENDNSNTDSESVDLGDNEENAPETLPTSIMLEVPIIKQAHRASCEVASLRASMLFYGIDQSEEYLLEQVTYDSSPRYIDQNGVLHWGNPQKGYVGNVDAPVIYVDGYGVYNEPIYRALELNGFSKSISKVGWDTEEMYNYLRRSYPVIVWISNDYSSKEMLYWVAPDETQVKWFYGEHAVVLRGIDENYVYIMDVGYGANKQVPIADFERGFANLGNMAIVVIPD